MAELPAARVSLESQGPIRVITIHNERHRNAITPAMHAQLLRILRDLTYDEDAAAVILTGAGAFFSAGGDIDAMVKSVSDEDQRLRSINEARAIVKAIADCSIPTIAAVNGPAVGAGCTFALLCDLVLVADSAYFSDPHVAVGLVAGDGGAIAWPLLVGLSRAKLHLFTGDPVSAQQAVEWGMAAASHPASELSEAAAKLAGRLLEQPAYALRATKTILNAPLTSALASALEASIAAELVSLHSSEHRKAVAAMVQERERRRQTTPDAVAGGKAGTEVPE